MLDGDAFEHPEAGGAGGDDAAAFRAGAREDAGGLGPEFEGFLMHRVVVHLCGFDRGERSESDVECDLCGLNAASPDSLQEVRGVVKTGCGCGYRTCMTCVDRLVGLEILALWAAGSMDVRGQGKLPDPVQIIPESWSSVKTQVGMAFGIVPQDFRGP